MFPRASLLLLLLGWYPSLVAGELRLGVFDIDATPPIGAPLAYDPNAKVGGSLRCKGLVFLGNDEPIVIVAVDWIGIGGEGHDYFRETIAKAVGTTRERVAVHALHQHDAPRFDLGAEELLKAVGLSGTMFDVDHALGTVRRAAEAAAKAKNTAKPLTHVALGAAKVVGVASNRRILGEDGKVKHIRWTATRDPKVRAFPEGVIDPWLKSIAFHSGDELLAVATWYATHPQSYYRTKAANADFPGLAREARQKATGAVHVHFTGAGGNVGAGKYNDGSPANRPVLAGRLQKGMADAFAAGKTQAVTADDLGWRVARVALPVADHLDEKMLAAAVANEELMPSVRVSAAKALRFLRRSEAGVKTDLTCLVLGRAHVLHLPGELFVEYQLAAAKMRPDAFVATAAYGDYAPGYICTKIAYGEGGYEPSARASRVSPEVEEVLVAALEKLLTAAD